MLGVQDSFGICQGRSPPLHCQHCPLFSRAHRAALDADRRLPTFLLARSWPPFGDCGHALSRGAAGGRAQREQPAAPASSQGLEQAPQIRRVQASGSNTDSLPTRSQGLGYQQPTLSNRAAQALASYSTTAAYASEYDAQEVLGLDLYA